MNSKEIIINELKKYDIRSENVKDIMEIRCKDGIYLYSFSYENLNCVIKYFEKEEYRREIYYYHLLNKLNIPTIKLYDSSDTSIILEDINASEYYRLGKKEDLSNPKIALGLINWYNKFHENSFLYLKTHSELFEQLYNEYDFITKQVINDIINKTSSSEYNYWKDFLNEFDKIKEIIKKQSTYLTYNDFYYTNFIVSKDESEVIMYDYNLLGYGFKYSDIRNVTSSLQGQAKDLFISRYNNYDIIEKYIDDVFSPIYTLYEAYNKESFPKWAEDELNKVNNGELEKHIKDLLDIMKHH